MDNLIKRIIDFRDERNWKQFHSPENLAKSISIEAAELLENFQWDESFDLDSVSEELADVFIYCINMADILGVDILKICNDKLDKNMQKYPISKSKNSNKKYTDL